MRFFATSVALAFIAAVVQAAPAPVPNPYNTPFQVRITFIGAAGAEFVQFFPGDGSVEPITNPLSISHIMSDGGATCTFYGIDHSVTTVVGAQTVDVGPPQTQVRGTCRAF